jgi:glycosyltransferase involved in cell wall biosynthesis
MKIVITVEEFDPNKGYLEYYLAKELTRLGHKVSVFTFGHGDKVDKKTLTEGFEVVSLPYLTVLTPYHIPSLSAVAHILRFIKSEKPEIIHCQPLNSPLSLVFISCKRLSRYRIVGSLITGEYSINSTIKSLKYNFGKIVIEHYVANRIAIFFAIDYGWKKTLLKLFNIATERIALIPLGADPSLFKYDMTARVNTRKLLGVSLDDIVVVYSGKIIPPKKLDILLKAIAPIIQQNYRVKLLLLGNGQPSCINYLKKLSSNLKISNNVIFSSWVHRTKLSDFYSASDIGVWPGSISISIIEAASVGLPIIVRRSLITNFATEYGNGFAFEPDNITELNAYLEKLITNYNLRIDMGEKSRLLVEQKLNWKTIAHLYLDAYRSIAYS